MKHLSPSSHSEPQDRVASAILVVLARMVALLFAAAVRAPRRRVIPRATLASECGQVSQEEADKIGDLWGSARIWDMVLPAVFPAAASVPVRRNQSPGPSLGLSHEGRGEGPLVPVRAIREAPGVASAPAPVPGRRARPASCADPPGGSSERGRGRHPSRTLMSLPHRNENAGYSAAILCASTSSVARPRSTESTRETPRSCMVTP